MQWRYGFVKWYVDGVQRAAYTNSSKVPHEDMFAQFTVEVDNNPGWHGTPPSNFDVQMKVDWFELFKWQ